jgi:hypothetical protein
MIVSARTGLLAALCALPLAACDPAAEGPAAPSAGEAAALADAEEMLAERPPAGPAPSATAPLPAAD